MKVLVTPRSINPEICGHALGLLRSFTKEIIFNTEERPLTEDELIPLLKDCDGCVAGLDHFTRKVIQNVSGLKVISRYGVGVDSVDLEAAREKGVAVCNTPGANSNAVADLTFGLLLCLARNLLFLDKNLREDKWLRLTGIELYGKTLGIIGLDAVGKAVAKRASGFSMKILAYDPFINSEYAKANGIINASFDDVTREADFLSLHLPLTKETRNIISGETMKAMKKGAIIINTARGGLIDEKAAYELLKSGHLGGLGLDAFEMEPPPAQELFTLDNVVLTPHTGAYTAEAMANMADMAVQNLIDVLSGRNCPNIVNL